MPESTATSAPQAASPQSQAPSQAPSSDAPDYTSASPEVQTLLKQAGMYEGMEDPTATPKQDEKRTVPQAKPERKAKELADIHERNKRLFAREKALKEQEAKYKAFDGLSPEEASAFKEAKGNPGKLLKIMGFEKFEQLVERLAQDGGVETPETKAQRELREKVEALEKRENEFKTQQEQREQDERGRQAVQKLNTDIAAMIKGNEKYQLIQLDGGIDQVHAEMQRHLDETYDEETQTGDLLTIEQAAERVEARMENTLRNLAKNGNPKVVRLLQEELQKLASVPGAASYKQPIKSITNTLQSGVPSQTRAKSESELMDEAIQMLRGARGR